MADEEARVIWETLTPEQREAVDRAAVKMAIAAKAFRELAEKVQAAFSTLLEEVSEVFYSLPLCEIIECINNAIEDAEIDEQPRKHWKPVKNTVPRYMCVQRRITPRARSCC